MLLRRGKRDEAVALAERMLAEKHLHAEGLLLQGRIAAAAGDGKEAKRRLQEAAAAWSDDADGLETCCRLLFEIGHPIDAEEALTALIRLRPEDAAAYHNLGTSYAQQGRARAAADAYRRSLAAPPGLGVHLAATGRCPARRRTGAGSDGSLGTGCPARPRQRGGGAGASKCAPGGRSVNGPPRKKSPMPTGAPDGLRPRRRTRRPSGRPGRRLGPASASRAPWPPSCPTPSSFPGDRGRERRRASCITSTTLCSTDPAAASTWSSSPTRTRAISQSRRLRRADACVCMARQYAEWLVSQGVRTVVHIPMGFDSYRYRPRLVLGVVGRLEHPRKGRALVDRVRQLPFVEVVTTEGRTPPEELRAVYERLDYVLIPATVEGGPLCLLEGLSMGKPVIAPESVGITPEFGATEHIRLYPPGDAAALVQVVTECYRRKEAVSRLVRNRSWDRWAEQHHHFFVQLLRARGLAAPTPAHGFRFGMLGEIDVLPEDDIAPLEAAVDAAARHLFYGRSRPAAPCWVRRRSSIPAWRPLTSLPLE